MSARPSNAWQTVQEHEDAGSYIAGFWKLLDIDRIEAMAKGFHPSKLSCRANRDRYAEGANAIVIELVFEDSTIWITRIAAPVNVTGSSPSDEVLARETESAVATMRFIRERTSIPVPTVFAYSATQDNPLGRQFIMMSVIRGSTPPFMEYPLGRKLLYNELPDHTKPVVDRYLRDLAKAYLELSKLRFDRIGALYFDPRDNTQYIIGCFSTTGLGPFETAWDYYHAVAERMENECLAIADDSPEAREGRALVLWLNRLGIASLASSLDNRGPFLFSHLDLHRHNTLVDETGAITGIIDWGDAGVVPVEVFATQALSWNSNFSNPTDIKRHVHEMFDSAIRAAQGSEEGTPFIPSGRTLLEIRASDTAYLVGHLPHILEGEMCVEEPCAGVVSQIVLGIDDPSPLKRSSVFREWYGMRMRTDAV